MNQKSKIIKFAPLLYLALYWIIFIVAPFLIILKINTGEAISSFIGLYIVFVAPFLFAVPYKLSKKIFTKNYQKINFVVFGLVIPYIVIYAYVVYGIMHIGAPHF